MAKQQKQIYDNQQKQETRITTISAQQINIEQMQNTINTHQQTINKQSEEIKKLYNSINTLNSTITKQDKQINDTNTSFIAAMDKINQQIIELNDTKEIVLKDSYAQKAVHENLSIIIAECIYENIENKKRKSIHETTQKTLNWVNSELNNALNSRISEIEHTNINHTKQQEYEPITDEQEIKLTNIDKTPERHNDNKNV